MDFEIKAYIANTPDEEVEKKYVVRPEAKPSVGPVSRCTQGHVGGTVILFALSFCGLRDTCRLMIRKIQFAPSSNKPGPKAEITKQFMMSDKPVILEASLEKEVHRSVYTIFWPNYMRTLYDCYSGFN